MIGEQLLLLSELRLHFFDEVRDIGVKVFELCEMLRYVTHCSTLVCIGYLSEMLGVRLVPGRCQHLKPGPR